MILNIYQNNLMTYDEMLEVYPYEYMNSSKKFFDEKLSYMFEFVYVYVLLL